MKYKYFLAIVMVAALILPSTLVSAADPPPVELAPVIQQVGLGWQLDGVDVVDKGQTSSLEQGTLITGYILEANATATDASVPVQEGRFRLTMSVFSPNRDMAGQKAGRWYLHGTWSVTDSSTSPAVAEVRHNPAVVQGLINTELDFNPLEAADGFTAAIQLPMSTAGGQWSAGEGNLTLGAGLGGTVTVDADVWPDVAPVAGIYDVPGGRETPAGSSVPNPGTQEQELANITFPSPYNVFEFVVTCAACHGGSVDQQAGHFGNWAGTAMASATRDPIFRANQQIVNAQILEATGEDGGGNVCIRCHSPNAWYSGRTDPLLAGTADGSTLEHSILLSTDDEGILCEFCHRSIGNVTMEDPDLVAANASIADDPVWNELATITDWPHEGTAYPDGPVAGLPYGDNTMQLNDGMAYTAKYPGSSQMSFSDYPITSTVPPTLTGYTGQTYAVYPPGWPEYAMATPPLGEPATNGLGEYIVYGPDGSVPIHLEAPVGPPLTTSGDPDYQAQAVSLEHPTYGDQRDEQGEGSFVTTPEFCGTCHDLTVPVLNHGMPEQRTYTEWKYSDFGNKDNPDTYTRCQDCHMPTMMHEYSDDAAVSVNPDPLVSGWFPYAKDRNPDGGTAFHKFDGSNLDLPDMMKLLYPEVDLEVIGAATGNDTRIFPGMLSNRDPMWERTRRNNEVTLSSRSIDVEIATPLAYNAGLGKWEVQFRVTNEAGHRLPSGYPDGRRIWLGLTVTDDTGATVYQSGYYDQASATLFTDETMAGFTRALTNTIDSDDNAVMVYEKVTGTCTGDPPTSCSSSVSLLNRTVLFDNRIPPAGYDYGQASLAGGKFWNYDPATFVPYEDANRFGTANEKNNYDVVTYRFSAPPAAVLTARAEVYWQTHTREFMEHLKDENTSTYRPQGPPSIFDVNYPLTPNYLSDQLPDFANMTDLDGNPLDDNWGGVAYASWLLTGKGTPFLAAAADTSVAVVPDAPATVGIEGIDPFTQVITWTPSVGADGYYVWIRYGKSDATADWDQLAMVRAPSTAITNTALNVAKTYAYKVEAFNAAGLGLASDVVTATTPVDLPLPPENLMIIGSTGTSISMSWYDAADNETGFIIERQDVPAIGDFYQVGDIPAPDTPGFGGVNWTDTTVSPGQCYNYRVAAYNASGPSTWNVNGPVQGCTGGLPSGTISLTATAISGRRVDLAWSGATGTIVGYRVERSSTGASGPWNVTFNVTDPNAVGYSDLTVQPDQTYWYRVFAYNNAGDSAPSNVATVTTPSEPPLAPSNLTGVPNDPWPPAQVNLSWTDNSTNETGFSIERGDGEGPRVVFAEIGTVGADVTTFNDTTVQPKMTYSYRVRAYNDGGPSDYSNVVVVVTPGEPPAAPSELRVLRTTSSYVALRWRDNSTNEEGFEIERSLDGGASWTLVATVGINVSTYKDSGLQRRTTYWYRVRAFNTSGPSEYSEVVSARTR